MVEYCDENSMHILLFHLFMINVEDIKSIPRHSIYVMHFKLVGLTSIGCYFLRKREIERSETGNKPLIRGRGRSPLKLNMFLLISSF